MIKYDLNNRVAVVTGGAQGFGLAITERFLEAGANVVIWDIDENTAKEAIDKLKSENLSYQIVDVTNFEVVNKNLKEVEKKHDKIDIFINNAGITFGYSRNAKLSNTGISLNKLNAFGHIQTENWLPIFKANCIAPLLLAQLLYKNIMLGKEKKMVFISSKPASITENTGGSMYMSRSSRSALNQVIKSLSIDLLGEGISVASISPGWVKTDSGGLNALIDVNTSVTGIRNVIENLTIKNSGKFWDYNGEFIPW